MNKHDFFLNKLDAFLYLCLSIIFPVFSFIIQIDDTNINESDTVFSFILTGLLFLITFFYDFYTRYEEAENVSPAVFGYYHFGLLLYVGFFLISIMAFILFGLKKITAETIVNGFALILLTSLYPLFMPIYYYVSNFKQDKKKKVKRFKV